MVLCSLVPRPSRRKRGPGIHCVRMRSFTKFSWCLDISVILSAKQPLSQSVAPTDRVTRSASPLPVLHFSLPLTDSSFVCRSASPAILHSSSSYFLFYSFTGFCYASKCLHLDAVAITAGVGIVANLSSMTSFILMI